MPPVSETLPPMKTTIPWLDHPAGSPAIQRALSDLDMYFLILQEINPVKKKRAVS
jgi:hypothetical protein